MIGLIFLGAMLPKAVKDFRSFDRIVTVKGLCEKEVPADKVIWPLVFKVVGNDISSVYAEISQKTATIKKFLTDGGIQDAEITVSVPVISDKYAQEYGIVVGSENTWSNPVEFKFEGLNDIKPAMIEEATKNAREVGEKFAKDSGSRLGKIKTANQGTFTIENRDSNTPNIKKVRVVTSVTYYLKK